MDLVLAAILCALGGCVAGLIGVGGGVIFVPAMTVALAKGQVEAEATSLLMIALVSVVGTWRQRRYGNVNLRDAVTIGLLSPVGVLVGVVAANNLPERALRVGFAILALYMATRLIRRAFTPDDPGPAEPESARPPGSPQGPGSPGSPGTPPGPDSHPGPTGR